MRSWYSKATGRPVRDGFKVGLEIELEGLAYDRLPLTPSGYTVIRDGSLRNGFELVSSQPMSYEDFLSSMSGLDTLFNKVRLHTTPRTSTHIHVNVTDLSPEKFTSFVWLSVAMEPVILEFCSELRQHNGYCLSLDKTTNLTTWWSRLLRAIHGERSYPADPPKYAALGMHRIYDLGTLEFRMFPGCKNVHKLRWYVDIIKAIYDQAMAHSVQQLQDLKTQEGVTALLSNIILDNRKRVTLQRLAACLEIGIRNANDIMRKRMTIEELKAWHRELFPNVSKEFDLDEALRIVTADGFALPNLTTYDPETIQKFVSQHSSYRLYQKAIAVGCDEVLAVRRSIKLFEHLNNPSLSNNF